MDDCAGNASFYFIVLNLTVSPIRLQVGAFVVVVVVLFIFVVVVSYGNLVTYM